MKITPFGCLPSGETVSAYTLENGHMAVTVLDLGGIVQRFVVDGTDIVAGFDTLQGYLADDSYQGAVIGRYANRIRGGSFVIDGKTCSLYKNENGKTHLHGGRIGFSRRMFRAEPIGDTALKLSLFDEDGNEGYPGNLRLTVTYALDGDDFSIHYLAVSDKNTVLNLTNHSYFNLNGYQNSDILSHTVTIDANAVTEVDDDLLPTGRNIPVENTVFDLRTPTLLGSRVGKDFGGYDHNFILNRKKEKVFGDKTLFFAARVTADRLAMEVYTDQPDCQLYIGNALTGEPPMKGGARKEPHRTFCLETQIAPDGPHFGRGFLSANETYDTTTVFRVTKK